MIIIGEKINGTLKKVAQAIQERDASFIARLAESQTAAGAAYLDVNAGTPPEQEMDDLAWLIQVVQDRVDTPICVDSANPKALAAVLPILKKPGMINSVNGEPDRLEAVLPLARRHQAKVIALLMDEKGIPETAVGRMEVARKIATAAREQGIEDEQVYFDPLVMAIATKPDAGRIFLETLRLLKQEFPEARTVSGLSNISFGLPQRRLLNQAFLVATMTAGLDAVILDPLDTKLMALLRAAEAVLGRDEYCVRYLRAYREGRLAES
jgi:5-methyltetrahydrofolate--homocysteine methyltransferase